MSHWDRRQALEMADAIANKINRADTAHVVRFALKPIAMESAKASLTTGTPRSAIDVLRSQLCAACKDLGLHHCDPSHGWPVRCAFMDANRK